jgi:hypothetical protein
VRVAIYPPAQCSAVGVSSASLATNISGVPGLNGAIDVSASLLPTEALISFSGSGSGAAGQIGFTVYFEVETQVPEIGDAMTPVYLSLEDLTETGSGWSADRLTVGPRRQAGDLGCPHALEAAVDSMFLGSTVGPSTESSYATYSPLNFGPAWAARRTDPLELIAGDTVVIPFSFSVTLAFAGSTGAFSDSVRIAFRTAPTTIGNGDVNGDAQVNVLDTTLIRRAIAGAPNP